MADKFQLKAILTGVDKFTPVLKGVQKKVLSLRKALMQSGMAEFSLGDAIAGGAMTAPFIEASRAAIDFESAMADVRKVVDFPTPEAFKKMQDDLIDMSSAMPMAVTGLAQIAAAGGQAGVARKELLAFTQDAVKMGVAFDQTAEESGEMMAKWRTSFKLTQKGVVELADKINHLSNIGAASTDQISGIVTRVGPMGEIAGFVSGELAAMGAALASVGVQEDVAATGMKNFMLTLNSGGSATAKQKKLFKALRMDAESVAESMQTDASGTMIRVLDTIAHVDRAKQAAVLSDLFGRESILPIASLLTNIDLLKKYLDEVGDSTQWAGSMQKEYEARSKTTAIALQLLRNQATAVGISVGNVLLPPILEFTKAAAPVLKSIRDIVDENPWLIKGILGATAAMIGAKTAIFGVATALKVVSMLMGGPWKFAIKGAVLLVGALVSNWDDFCATVKKAVAAIREFLNTPLGELFGSDKPPKLQTPKIEGIETQKVRPIQHLQQRQVLQSSAPLIGEPLKASREPQPLNGNISVTFQNAPQGMRVENRSPQGPIKMETKVGYRSLAFEGGND